MERPIGVTILSVLAIIAGVLGIHVGLSLLEIDLFASLPQIQESVYDLSLGSHVSTIDKIFGRGALILGVLNLVIGLGLWWLKGWAWRLGVEVQWINIVVIVIGWFSRGFYSNGILPILINGWILWFLYRPHVKLVFGRT